MSGATTMEERVAGVDMKRRRSWYRVVLSGLAGCLALILAGDRAFTSVPDGIDPLQVLDRVVAPNVIFVVDSNLDMGKPPDTAGFWVGGDDPASRLFQVKAALRKLIDTYSSSAQMGIVSFAPKNLDDTTGTPIKVLTDVAFSNGLPVAGRGGPLIYVSQDAGAGDPGILSFFTQASGVTFANYDGTPLVCASGGNCEIWRSFTTTENGFATAGGYPTGCTVGTDCRFYIKSRLFRDGVKISLRNAAGGKPTTGVPVVQAFTCPAPPATLFPDDPPGQVRPCFRFELLRDGGGEGLIAGATYYYSSGGFSTDAAHDTDAESCGGVVLNTVAACNANNDVTALKATLAAEMPITLGGTVTGLRTSNALALPGDATAVPTTGGIRLANLRIPRGEAMRAAHNYYDSTVFPARPSEITGIQKNYVILVTGGDRTCGSTSAISEADDMYRNHSNQDRMETIVVGYGANVIAGPAATNSIARAGSGGIRDAFLAATRSQLDDALNAAMAIAMGRKDTDNVPDEFSDQQSITESVYELVRTASPQPSPEPADPDDPDTRYDVTVPLLLQSTFELQALPSPPVPPVASPTPSPAPTPAPTFRGHLRAFRNISGVAIPAWADSQTIDTDPNKNALTRGDAGRKLRDRVVLGMSGACAAGTSNLAGECTYAKLIGSGVTGTSSPFGLAAPFTPPTGAGIRRRIFTTKQNGKFAYLNDFTDKATTSSAQVPYLLWPNTGLDTTLDVALGIASMSQAELETQFGACKGDTAVTLPSGCTSTNATTKLNATRQEARQMLLAFTAGAEVVQTAARNPKRDSSGALLFMARGWILAESSLSAPAVLGPPIQSPPSTTFFGAEYTLYRDGPRTVADVAQDGISLVAGQSPGFGLRNPDLDAPSGSNGKGGPGNDTRTSLKPLMSVVYHGANDGLHALRAGPSCTTFVSVPISGVSAKVPNCDASGGEVGGEEMWLFVPFDELGKLRKRMKPQSRDNHVFMVASPTRFSDVFVKAPSGRTWSGTIGSASVQGAGKWRTIAMFGRGKGGKYYTALDVTGPGQYNITCANAGNAPSLCTAAPAVLWSRGNPDTTDGRVDSDCNGTGDDLLPVTLVGTTADCQAYRGMGETWSVPAIVRTSNSSEHGGRLFVAYTGSGFGSGSNAANEGTTFYELDVTAGDVVKTVDVGDRAGEGFENALVASPAGFAARQLSPGFVGNPANDPVTQLYVGDIHGRLWKMSGGASFNINTSNPFFDLESKAGTKQPVAVGAALLNYNGDGSGEKPHIYMEAGYDNRVSSPAATSQTPPFKMWGFRDDGGANAVLLNNVAQGEEFPIDFPTSSSGTNFPGFRGTVQPTSAFSCVEQPPPPAGTPCQTFAGRVFFAGVQFRYVDSGGNPRTSPGQPGCLPAFDSLLFAVGAATGQAVYDFGQSYSFSGERITAIRVTGGRLVVDRGLEFLNAPAPPQPPTLEQVPAGTQADVYVQAVSPNSAICR